LSEALKIVVARPVGTVIPDIVISPIGIALPDFDPCPRPGMPGAVEDPTDNLRDGSLRR